MIFYELLNRQAFQIVIHFDWTQLDCDETQNLTPTNWLKLIKLFLCFSLSFKTNFFYHFLILIEHSYRSSKSHKSVTWLCVGLAVTVHSLSAVGWGSFRNGTCQLWRYLVDWVTHLHRWFYGNDFLRKNGWKVWQEENFTDADDSAQHILDSGADVDARLSPLRSQSHCGPFRRRSSENNFALHRWDLRESHPRPTWILSDSVS